MRCSLNLHSTRKGGLSIRWGIVSSQGNILKSRIGTSKQLKIYKDPDNLSLVRTKVDSINNEFIQLVNHY